MEIILIFVVIVALAGFAQSFSGRGSVKGAEARKSAEYRYLAKNEVMTPAETSFYKRLEKVVDGRYYIFPQIHLSSLMINKTMGKYYKLGYQRIQRRSVDYVLCDKTSMKPIYAVELDDSTHDNAKREGRDSMVEGMLRDINLPLVRFRNVSKLTDDQITQKFKAAATKT